MTEPVFPTDFTLLAEMIHPRTHVIRTYDEAPHFCIVGAVDNRTLTVFDHDQLLAMGTRLGLRVTERRTWKSLAALRKHMKDRTVTNREGYVVEFPDGPVKFKFETYLGEMFARKFSHGYAMRMMAAGKLAERMRMLPEEIVPMAKAVVAEISKVKRMKTPLKERWTYLYGLVPEDQRTDSYKTTCRDFVKKVCG
jgi:hypothetical protein